MDIICRIWPDHDLDPNATASHTMILESMDEGKTDTIKIMVGTEDFYADWHDLADAVDMLGRVLGKGQGCIGREERL